MWKENKVYYVNGVIMPQRNAYDFYHSKPVISDNRQVSDTSTYMGKRSHTKEKLVNIPSECSNYSIESTLLPRFPLSEEDVPNQDNEEFNEASSHQEDNLKYHYLNEEYDNVPDCYINNDVLAKGDGKVGNLHLVDEHNGVQMYESETNIGIKKQFDPGGVWNSHFKEHRIRQKSNPNKSSGCFSCCGARQKQKNTKEQVSIMYDHSTVSH